MKIYNRKFNRDFQIIDKFEFGLVLTGQEVKSVRTGTIILEDSYIKILGSEAYLVNAQISVYNYAGPLKYDPKRSRKILLHKDELIKIKTKINSISGLTVVPILCYNKGNLIKIQAALVKGRRDIEKRKLEKNRDIERQEKREAKEYMKT